MKYKQRCKAFRNIRLSSLLIVTKREMLQRILKVVIQVCKLFYSFLKQNWKRWHVHLNLSIENARIPTRKSSCYLREYAAYFYPSTKEPGLVIRQVTLRFAQVLVCIHILFVYYVSRQNASHTVWLRVGILSGYLVFCIKLFARVYLFSFLHFLMK